jgi:hypothetical protein
MIMFVAVSHTPVISVVRATTEPSVANDFAFWLGNPPRRNDRTYLEMNACIVGVIPSVNGCLVSMRNVTGWPEHPSGTGEI